MQSGLYVTLSAQVALGWKGRVINALGLPIDAAGPLELGARAFEVDASPPPAMRRSRVQNPLKTGVRVIDLFTPLCAGQRIGILPGLVLGNQPFLQCSPDRGILMRS
jgi:flagellum-specific ATP synthase